VSPPLGPFANMPAPALPDSADGYDAFDDSVKQANTNLNTIPSWAAGIQTAVTTGQTFTTAAVTAAANWRVDTFSAFKLDHVIQMDATMTLTGVGFSFSANGQYNAALLTLTDSALRPLVRYVSCLDTRVADTGCSVLIGYPTFADVTLHSGGATPSRAIATGAQLRFHAFYLDQWVDTTIPA
jgi:hypothetical protein